MAAEINAMQASTPKRYATQLRQDGNKRPHLDLATQDLGDPSRPKSILLTPKHTPKKDNLFVRFEDTFQQPARSASNYATHSTHHDWISSLMDNSCNINDNDPCESNLKDILEFRRVNREECQCDLLQLPQQELGLTQLDQSSSSDQPLPDQKVRHYYVNDRLFLQPVYPDDENCRDMKAVSDLENIRVTLRHSVLEPPYKIKPHRRNSFDPSDSLSLSQHCLAGWKNSKLNITRSSSPMDLRSASNQSNRSTPIQAVDGQKANKTPSSSTKDLIDRMHAINYSMQLLEKEQHLLQHKLHNIS